MRQKTDKKLISFAKLPLIDRLVKDEAEIENRSESAIIENHLLDSFLPENEQARWFVEGYLYGDGERKGIGATLEAIFSYNAAGTRGAWSSKYGNLLPIVQFAHSEQCFCNTIPTGEENELYHFRSQLDSICNKFELLAEEATDSSRKYYYEKEAKFARELLKEATNEPQFMRYCNFYQLIIDNWEDLKDWSITFRMLCDLASMEKGWRDNPDTRRKLLQLINDISVEWND